MKSINFENESRTKKTKCIGTNRLQFFAVRQFTYTTRGGTNSSGYEVQYNNWESMIKQEKDWVNKKKGGLIHEKSIYI